MHAIFQRRLKASSVLYVLLFLASLALFPCLALADEAGVFTKVQGRVDVLRSGANAAVPAKALDIVSTGDIVRTKSDGRAVIVFKDDTTLNIAPESRISIDEYMFADGTRKNAALSLFRGKIRAIVSKGGLGVTPVAVGSSDFSVRTPTGVMGVKGTDFFMFFTSGITGVIFREGSGFLFNPALPDRVVDVATGFMTQILKGTAPPLFPRRVTDAELNAHIRHTTIEGAKKEDSGEKPPTEEAGAEAPDADEGAEGLNGAEAGEDAEAGYEESVVAGLSAKGLEFDGEGTDIEDGAETQAGFTEDGSTIEEEAAAESEIENEVPYTETEEEAIDSEAPDFSLVHSTNSVTNSPNASFSLAATEDANYSYRLDNGGWVSTGPEIYFTGLSEGIHTLDVSSTDSAGNTSTTTYAWFYGARHYSLYGAIEGAGISGEGTGDLALLSYAYSGAWAQNLSGTASNEGAFSAKAGGTGYLDSGYVSGYWNESLEGNIGEGSISGSSDFTFLSLYSLITGPGSFSGTAGSLGLELSKEEDTEGGIISWSMTDAGMGTLTEEPLSFVSTVYTEAYNFYGELAYFHSLLGGVDSLWTTTRTAPAEALWVGEFSMPDYGSFLLQYGGYNYLNYTDTTYDNGAYWGFMTGAYALGGLESNLFFLYIDPDQGAGILVGSLESSDGAGPFMAEGEIFPVEITSDIGVSPFDLLSYVIQRDFSTASGSFRLNSQNLGSSYGRAFNLFYQNLTIGTSDWGVWNSRIRGSYSGITTTDAWNSQYEYASSTFNIGFKTTGSKWSEGLIEGSTVGYAADNSTAMAWVLGGDVIGTFDPTAYTYDVVQAGAHLEVRRFLAMTQTASGQSALISLNIPYAEVGRTDLTGSDGNLSVNMNDVVFFAYSTGATPQIWATKDISGTYVTTPSTNTVVSISNGTGLSANFTTQSWADSLWGASVSGSGTYSGTGTMNGSSVQFTGAATGPYGSGTFSGTGAGIVR